MTTLTADAPAALPVYQPLRPSRIYEAPLRHALLRGHVWGTPDLVTPERPPLLLAHGYMDVGASFQFFVDELARLEGPTRYIVAPDWRGFGRSSAPPTDHHPFMEHVADLDALLTHAPLALAPGDAPLDLLGHSMGGNVVTIYAGARPERVRRLVNAEGFGLLASAADAAPAHLRRWLDALATPARLKPYPSAEAVAARMRQSNPRLDAPHALWLAQEWAAPGADGLWHLRADAAHKRPGAQPFRLDELLACWRAITAPVLWVEGADTDFSQWWGSRFGRADIEPRLAAFAHLERAVLPDCGHMLHHDQPALFAARVREFLDGA